MKMVIQQKPYLCVVMQFQCINSITGSSPTFMLF